MRPSASPSTIHISHRGRLRSSWCPAISPARSASWCGPAGLGYRRQPDVIVDVEVGIVDPDRVPQPERDLDQAAPEDRRQRDPGADRLLHPFEGVPARHGGRVEHEGEGHVHVVGRRLQVEEAGVEPAQSLHALPSLQNPDRRCAGRQPCFGLAWLHIAARTVLYGGWPGSSSQFSMVFALLVVNAFFPSPARALHGGQLRLGVDSRRAPRPCGRAGGGRHRRLRRSTGRSAPGPGGSGWPSPWPPGRAWSGWPFLGHRAASLVEAALDGADGRADRRRRVRPRAGVEPVVETGPRRAPSGCAASGGSGTSTTGATGITGTSWTS